MNTIYYVADLLRYDREQSSDIPKYDGWFAWQASHNRWKATPIRRGRPTNTTNTTNTTYTTNYTYTRFHLE